MKVKEIRNDREFYQAVREYAANAWRWGAADIDDDCEPTPDELIAILAERIEWVRAHTDAVDRYLRRRSGPTWVRVVDGPGRDPG